MRSFSVLVALVFLAGSALADGWSRQTGRLIVTFTDRLTGGPITDAVVTVKTLKDLFPNAGALESHYAITRACADTNGVVDISFNFISPDFRWTAETPSHYSQAYRFPHESFDCSVVQSDYLVIDTNTVSGAMRQNELETQLNAGDVEGYVSKFEPTSVSYGEKIVRRSVALFPKLNPQPMYAYYEGDRIPNLALPQDATIVTNDEGVVKRFPDVGFTFRKQVGARALLCAPDEGGSDRFDFRLVRAVVETNGIRTAEGYIEFPNGGGYRGLKTGDRSFPAIYEASTNDVDYAQRLYFHFSRDLQSRRMVSVRQLAATNEYIVMRTSARGENGDTGYCYSIMQGGVGVGRWFTFESLIHNPCPNDPNLECDHERNLAK